MKKLFARSENWGSAALLAFPVAIAALLVYEGSGSFVWLAALTIVAISIALEAGRRMNIVRLRNRVAANHDTTWAIFVNGVLVGKIKDMDYAQVKLRAWLSPGNYVSQANNWIYVALRTVAVVSAVVPLVFVWLVAILAVLHPAEITGMFNGASQMTAHDASSIASAWTSIVLFVFIFVVFGVPFFGFANGYVDCFERDTNNRVRRITGTPANGDVSIVPESTADEELPTAPSAA
jgi:hypothetical protein